MSLKKMAGVLCALALVTSTGVFAQDDKPEQVTLMSVDVPVVSNYIFRGNAFSEETSPFGIAPAVQPSIDLNLGRGLSANVWTSYTLLGRGSADGESEGSATADYKELDEVDLSINYTRSTSIGDFNAGVIGYYYTQAKAATDTEVYVGYAPKFLSVVGFSITTYGNIVDNEVYNEYGFGKGLGPVDVGLVLGHLIPGSDLTTITHVGLNLGYTAKINKNLDFNIFGNANYVFNEEGANGKNAAGDDISQITSFVGLGVTYKQRGNFK